MQRTMWILALAAAQTSPPANFAMHGVDWTDGSCVSRTAQSPVDFEALGILPSKDLVYDYPIVSSNISLNARAHALEVDSHDFNSGSIGVDGSTFNLLYIDVHSPAEHTIRGVRAPLEIQLYHKAGGNPRLAVVSVFVTSANVPTADSPITPFTAAPPTTDQDFNADLQPLLEAALPTTIGQGFERSLANRTGGGFDLGSLFKPVPAGNASFWMYDGSMTAPPCAETVRWFVRREKLMASEAQINMFSSALRNMTGGVGNYRSVMPWNDRKPIVFRSRRGSTLQTETVFGIDGRLRSGPHPRTDNELQAVKQAELADQLAKQSVEYVKDIEQRMEAAADSHLEKLQGQRKAAEEEGMRRVKAEEPVPLVTVPEPVAKHFMPLVRGLADQAAEKVIAGVRAAAQSAAKQETKRVRIEAGRQQYALHGKAATAMTPLQAEAAAKAAAAR